MRRSLLLSGLSVGALLLLPAASRAQWQPDVRLTTDAFSSFTTVTNAWCVGASGSNVHVVWYDNRDGNQEVYYKRSTDRGMSWSADVRLTSNTAPSLNASIAVSGSTLHVVWEDGRDGNYEIYYKRSTDGGISWGSDIRLTSDAAASFQASVSATGATVHVVWRETRDAGNYDLYHKRSTDGGASWGSDARLTSDPSVSYLPSVSASGTNVHLAWWDNRDGNDEIYYKRSADGGLVWGSDVRLTSDSAGSQYASVSVSGPVVHVAWRDYRHGNSQIYYKRSTNGGVAWGTDTRMTVTSAVSELPSVSASGSFVHVVWRDDRDGSTEIYYKSSTDGGVSWGSDTRLTSNPSMKLYSSVAASDSVVHAVWTDSRDGNYEVYYKRNPTGNVTGIRTVGSEVPGEFTLEQNYPNPFNPGTTIEFTCPRRAFVTLRVYDMLGREVATLISQVLSPGRYRVPWDAGSIPSGAYAYRLQAGQSSQTRTLIVLR